MGTCVTLWFRNPCNIRKKCYVASASKNIPYIVAALHKVTITKINFHPCGLFDNWENGTKRLLTAADFVTIVAGMPVE